MHDLNKNQIVLLTLLVSFVTSIATGIITVSLLQQAPLEVTRNINRVVEKTIETVTPTSVLAPRKEKDTTTTTTVVVKEEDLVMSSINKNISSIVRVNEKTSVGGFVSFYGIGIVTSKDGNIIAVRKPITEGNVYVATFSDGSEADLNPIGVDKKSNFILFKLLKPVPVKSQIVPVSVSDGYPQLGQTVIALGGETQNTISVGRVSSFNMKTNEVGTSTVKYVSGIATDVSSKDLVVGSPLFNLSGDMVGIKISEGGSNVFLPTPLFKKEIQGL